MKHKIVKRTVALLITLSVAISAAAPVFAATPTFSDVSADNWAFEYVERAAALGLVNGTGDGYFTPNREVSFAEFMTMLVRAFANGEEAQYTTQGYAWWYPYMECAYQKGYMTDTSAAVSRDAGWWDENAVNTIISRYEMSQIIFNVVTVASIQQPTSVEKMQAFTDIFDRAKVPARYKDAVTFCYATKVINGDERGQFNGDQNMTRAQAATVMCRLADYTGAVAQTTPTPTQEPEVEYDEGPMETYGKPTLPMQNPSKVSLTYKLPEGSPYTENTDMNATLATKNGLVDIDMITLGANSVEIFYAPRVRTYADKINAVRDVGKNDEYPTTGIYGKSVSKNGYHTGCDPEIGDAILADYSILEMVNKYRRENGVPEVEWVKSDAAEEYTLKCAYDISKPNNFTHTRKGMCQVMENIASGFYGNAEQEVIDAWMKSPGHRSTMMEDVVQFICVARCHGKWIMTTWHNTETMIAERDLADAVANT